MFDHEGNAVPFRSTGRYFHILTGRAGADGAERLLTLNRSHGPAVTAYSPDPTPESPAWVWGFPFPVWSHELSEPPAGFVVADMNADGIEEIVVAESGGEIYCLKEEGSYPLDTAQLSETWRINVRETLAAISTGTNPQRLRMVAAVLNGKGRHVAILSSGTLFVIGGDGTPLVRRELTHKAGTPVGAADLDGKGIESLLVGEAEMARWSSRDGFVVAYDLE